MKVSELTSTEFPECSKKCEMLPLLGVGECESCCPHKFDKDGNSIPITQTPIDKEVIL